MPRFENKGKSRSRNDGFSRGRRGSRPREMHKAVCGKCGKDCEVPFKPTEGKPVLCKECFDKSDNRPRSGGFNRGSRRDGDRFRGGRFNRGGRRDDRGPREMHKAVCDECKKDCEVPFKPTKGKPVLCKECFDKKKT